MMSPPSAENLIEDIGPQIHQCKKDLARQEVQLDNLTDDVDRLERAVSRGERKLKMGAELLAHGLAQEVEQLDEKFYLEIFQPTRPRARAASKKKVRV